MEFQDKSIQCCECGAEFVFSAEEQEFFRSKGYTNEPKRCTSCRRARNSARSGEGGYRNGPERRMYTATCAACGKDAEVPFEPSGDRPVYCSDCYARIRVNR
jgi:CxxC-x17-CxxC domain-containing protein